MEKYLTQKVYLLSFLDSLCYGLIIPVIAPQTLILGGNSKILGLLVSLQVLLQSYSQYVQDNLNRLYSIKTVFIIQLVIGLISNMTIGIVTSHWDMLLYRSLFYLTNQTQPICEFLLKAAGDKHSADKYLYHKNLLHVLGFILGPIVGGFLFGTSNGFYKISQLASLCSVLCIILAFSLQTSHSKIHETVPLFDKLLQDVGSLKKNAIDVFKSNNKNILLSESLKMSSLTTFFSKFAIILRTLHSSTPIYIGITVAYQNIIILLINISFAKFGNFITSKSKHNNVDFVIGFTFLILSVTSICFNTVYIFYLISFLFLALSHHFLNVKMKDYHTAMKVEENCLNTTRYATNLIFPLILGFCCDFYGFRAIQTFAIVPLLISFYILAKNDTYVKVTEEIKSKSKDD